MVYYDDQTPPLSHQALPYDPWDDPSNPPAAPQDEVLRQAIRDVMDGHPHWGPSRIRAHLTRHGQPGVTLTVIHGVKAGM